MSDTFDPNIYLDGNSKHEQFALTTPSSSDGSDSAATGLTLTVHYSLTWGGASINAALTKTLTEYSGLPGTYHATQTGSSIATYLADKGGERVFAVIKNAAGEVKGNFDRYVKDHRPM